MTADEAVKLRSFKEYCGCGGAGGMTGRPKADIHMGWCPQYDEWHAWFNALPVTHYYKADALKERR